MASIKTNDSAPIRITSTFNMLVHKTGPAPVFYFFKAVAFFSNSFTKKGNTEREFEL
ncbi:UNVERIFIED_CONTAM: hypothetical protein ABID98_000313 [Brevibacillus sp. OAP136]